MFNRRIVTAAVVVTLILHAAPSTWAKDWDLNLKVPHYAQQENWSCGPNTIGMWAGYLSRSSLDTKQIAKKYTGVNNGTTIPEFMNAMFNLTPYGYVFSEWEYKNKYTAIKGVMYTVARFNEPVAISGNRGEHYYLVVGGGASSNPYTNYGKKSNIKYLYLLDSREKSPLYTNPKINSTGFWSIALWPVFKKGHRYSPEEVMQNWTQIGSLFDKKWRSVERAKTGAWRSQGATYENNDKFSSY